jgi:hypothetical protein
MPGAQQTQRKGRLAFPLWAFAARWGGGGDFLQPFSVSNIKLDDGFSNVFGNCFQALPVRFFTLNITCKRRRSVLNYAK